MRAIYEPKGKAREYCELALNLYTGCLHGCKYCYVPMILRKSEDEFQSKLEPRWEAINQLKKEVNKYKGRTVFLCFSCDPYQFGYNPITTIALEILLSNGVNVEILTKAGKRSFQDFYLLRRYKEQVKYGVTLTFSVENDSFRFEPHAASPEERIEALSTAHYLGLKTWVSLEPVIDKMQTWELIHMTLPYVDEYRIGKLNYFELGGFPPIDWKLFLPHLIIALKIENKKYLIKDSLKPYLKEGL